MHWNISFWIIMRCNAKKYSYLAVSGFYWDSNLSSTWTRISDAKVVFFVHEIILLSAAKFQSASQNGWFKNLN